MLNFRDLRPSIGTLSVPVTNVRKFFLSSSFNLCKNSQRYLCKYDMYLITGVSRVYPPS